MATDWTQAGMFWATAALALITIGAFAVNYIMLRELHDPHVIVYSQSDPARRQLIMIVMANIGKSVAKNIRFTLSEPLPRHSSSAGTKPMTEGPLITGIPALAPGESRIVLWGPFLGMWPVVGTKTYTVTASFQSDAFAWMSPREHEVESVLELASFWGCDAVDTDGARATAKKLEDVVSALKVLAASRPEAY